MWRSCMRSNHPKTRQDAGSACNDVFVSALPTSSLDSRVEYRALEGFVFAISPFNFTAIGGNLPGGKFTF